MPLQSVPDPFDDATHRQLDSVVNDATIELDEPIPLTLKYAFLLVAIVEHSNDVLDPAYHELGKACTLVKAYDELQEKLGDALARKSYRDIRKLAILQGLQTAPNYIDPRFPDLHRSLSKSFEADFRGAAVEALYECLTHNSFLFKNESNPSYFAKICPMLQSSGTGKSRVLLELHRKNVIVLYMNLRDWDDFTGFPARDVIPSKILTDFSSSHYARRCYSFFTALFVVLKEHLAELLASDDSKANIKRWAEEMCSVSYPPKFTARNEFFNKVFRKYQDICVEMSRPHGPMYAIHLCEAVSSLCKYLQEIYPEQSNEPRVVIAIDEAQKLATMQGWGSDEHRPADTLYYVVNEISYYGARDQAVWVVFASTSSEIAEFTPPKYYSSARIVYVGSKLFALYTQLGWDQNALGLGGVSIEDISKLWHIAGFGRPMWYSLMNTPTGLSTMTSKLCGGRAFNPKETSHVLAVLDQRFCFNVSLGHPHSAMLVDTGVIKHLRICHSMTLDRKWKFTSYPSEPLLSCVAAHHLHHDPGNLETALATLERDIGDGIIDLDKRGELTSRLLWLLAKDLYIRDSLDEPTEIVTKTPDKDLRDAEVVDCQMIPVVDWLGFVFGEQIWDKISRSLVLEHFQHAFLNFSHWISMVGTIAGSEDNRHVELFEWTLRHWQRTSAVQCCPSEPLVDQMIPIYFKEPGETRMSAKRVSQIFVRNETRKKAHSKDHLAKFTRKDPSFVHLAREENRRASDADKLPYVAILIDLGRPWELEVTYTENDVDDRCLRIYAASIDATVYSFLSKRPDVLTTLEKLVRRQQVPETDTPVAAYLATQFGFGMSGLPQHMLWENWKNTLDVRGESEEK